MNVPTLPPSKDQLRITGICRDADCATSLALFFNRVPTDDEMRDVHESLRPSHEPPAKQCSKGGECGYLDGKGSCIYCGEPHPDQPSALRDALDAIASPSRPEDYGWWTQVARRALGVATANETADPPPLADIQMAMALISEVDCHLANAKWDKDATARRKLHQAHALLGPAYSGSTKEVR